MFIYLLIYYVVLLLLLWANAWYMLFLWLYRLFAGEKGPKLVEREDSALPTVAVLIPCFNDVAFVEDKIRQLLALDYPRDRLNVYFLDGMSDDGTQEKVTELAKDAPFIHFVPLTVRGKIHQINAQLGRLTEEIVVNNDIDTLLEPGCLRRAVAVLGDESVGVVGAYVEPFKPIEFERLFWQTQNLLRLLENHFYSSSIVIAPFYAYRRQDFGLFPVDCIADDVYISFYMCAQGVTSYYDPEIKVCEVRNPRDFTTLLRHKFRKSNAYIREIFRFLYLMPEYHPRWKLILTTRLLQTFFNPWLQLLYGTMSVSLVFINLNYLNVVGFVTLLYGISTVLAHFATRPKETTIIRFRGHRLQIIQVFLTTVGLLMVSGVVYPFYRQSSQYRKIRHGDSPPG